MRVHASGRPYTDPSGVRLRSWLGIGEEIFYDPKTVAIVAMGFCFPGLDGNGGDLPPRGECAELWRKRLLALLPNLELILLVGQYAQKWHLDAKTVAKGLSETVGKWRDVHRSSDCPRLIPLPHPSWRNNAWLKRNPWFEIELLPVLRAEVARIVTPAGAGFHQDFEPLQDWLSLIAEAGEVPHRPGEDASMSGEIARRGFVRAMGAAIMAAAGIKTSTAQTQQAAPWSSGIEAPKLKAPPNACDCHMHIYDSRFPVAPNAKLRPPDATVDAYRLFQKRIGTTRNVVVTPSTYGTDNSVSLDAMAKLGATARGVAVVDTSVTDAELKRLNDLGVRGVRFNLVQSGATTIDMLEPLSKRVNDLGWHVQIHMLGDHIVENADLLQRLPSPIVFDHLARIPQPAGVDHPAFALVLKLLDKGRTWVKLSGAYQDTRTGPPAYVDVSTVARAYVKASPERLVWASDWPHPTEKADRKPDDAILFDLLADWAPNEATRNHILVTNPAALYGFG